MVCTLEKSWYELEWASKDAFSLPVTLERVMMTLRRWLALASVAALANGQVQLANLQLPSNASTQQQAVVDLFTTSYEAYQSVSFRVQLAMVLTCGVGNMHGVMTNCFRSRSRIPMI